MRHVTEGRPKVRVFTPPTFEGVTSVAVLEEILHKDIEKEIIYTGHLDFRDYEKFKGAEVTIVLGLPYHGYALSDDFYIENDVPFEDFLHFGNYGQEIKGKYIISVVDAEADPLKGLYQYLQSSPDSTMIFKHLTFTDKAQHLVDAANAYRTWTWEGNNLSRMLLALYQASYKRMPKLLQEGTLPEIAKRNAAVIKGQMERMGDYIEQKRGQVKESVVEVLGESCTLKVVYAEQYINELANDLLNRDQSPRPLIVCVGRATKGDDMFSIRTRGINAGQVAYLINEGNGKENVASVFTGVSYSTLMSNAVLTKLSRTE